MKNKSCWILLLVFCLFLFGYNYSSKNMDKIFLARADFYYKNKEFSKAQKFYEKAFELGYDKPDKRELYIDSLINQSNSPEVQEKVLKFLEYDIDDVANLKARYYIEDLKNEIEKKYPNNYILNSVYNQKILRWGNLPITYSFENVKQVPDYFIDEIEQAFKKWQEATNSEIAFKKTEGNSNIVIKFETENPADNSDKKYIVAYTVPQTDFNKLIRMDVIFYLKDIQNNYFTNNQVYNTALHEIAHAIGFMGHCSDNKNILYLTKKSDSVINDTRENLSYADINTIKLLYKIKPEITNNDKSKSEYLPVLVLGANNKINDKKIEEALIYIKSAPNIPIGYIDLAEAYLLSNNYEQAIKTLKQALYYAETDDIKSMVYYNLAVSYFSYDKTAEARKYLKKSIDLVDSDEKHYLLAEIFAKENNSVESIKEYSMLVKKYPHNIEYAIGLINLCVKRKDLLKARKTLQNFLRNNPQEKNNPRFSSYGILKIGL